MCVILWTTCTAGESIFLVSNWCQMHFASYGIGIICRYLKMTSKLSAMGKLFDLSPWRGKMLHESSWNWDRSTLPCWQTNKNL